METKEVKNEETKSEERVLDIEIRTDSGKRLMEYATAFAKSSK